MSEAASDVEAESDGITTCPYCTDTVPSLVRIDSGMKLRLQESAQVNPIPEAVCDGCFKIFTKLISKGAVLRSENKAKEQNRLTLWRNRVQLVKQAKAFLAQQNFSDAAVAYEKYLRVLEIIYEQKPGELSPDLFKNEARSQEMTVIASVYWDLMRIYDTHTRYADRQLKAGEKLAQFVRFTPIYPQIMRKAESQSRTAKNPAAFKKFLSKSQSYRPRCFIATSAFDGCRTESVHSLCLFRDIYLKKSRLGRRFVFGYYKISPALAACLDNYPSCKPAVRRVLNWIAQTKIVRNCLKP